MTSTGTSMHLQGYGRSGCGRSGSGWPGSGRSGSGWSGQVVREALRRSAGVCVGVARVLAPHTFLCPQVGRNFLEIVKHHWSVWRVWHVWRVEARRGEGESPRRLEPASIGLEESVVEECGRRHVDVSLWSRFPRQAASARSLPRSRRRARSRRLRTVQGGISSGRQPLQQQLLLPAAASAAPPPPPASSVRLRRPRPSGSRGGHVVLSAVRALPLSPSMRDFPTSIMFIG